jgi:hypothetical protein
MNSPDNIEWKTNFFRYTDLNKPSTKSINELILILSWCDVKLNVNLIQKLSFSFNLLYSAFK